MEKIYNNQTFLIIMCVFIVFAIIFLLTKAIFKFLITTILIFIIFFGATQSHIILDKYGDKLTPTEKTLINKIDIKLGSINRKNIDNNINKLNKIIDDSNNKVEEASEILEQTNSNNK